MKRLLGGDETMIGLDSLKDVLSRCEIALIREPDMIPLQWVIEQLKYLIDLEKGQTKDITKLRNIKIGWIAVRELDGFEDKELISLLCSISQQVEKLIQELDLDSKENSK